MLRTSIFCAGIVLFSEMPSSILLEAGQDPHTLLSAAEAGDVNTVTAFLEAGADVNTADADGYTALMLAGLRGHADVVRILLDRGARLQARTRSGAWTLDLAVSAGSEEIVKLLCDRGVDVNAAPPTGGPPFYVAVEGGSPSLVRALLACGADPNTTFDGYPVLRLAISQPEVLEILLGKGANVNARDRTGQTALMVASYARIPRVVRILLAHGADVHTEDAKHHYTALWLLLCVGSPAQGNPPETIETLRLLLDQHLDVNAKGRYALIATETTGTRRLVRHTMKFLQQAARKEFQELPPPLHVYGDHFALSPDGRYLYYKVQGDTGWFGLNVERHLVVDVTTRPARVWQIQGKVAYTPRWHVNSRDLYLIIQDASSGPDPRFSPMGQPSPLWNVHVARFPAQ